MADTKCERSLKGSSPAKVLKLQVAMLMHSHIQTWSTIVTIGKQVQSNHIVADTGWSACRREVAEIDVITSACMLASKCLTSGTKMQFRANAK